MAPQEIKKVLSEKPFMPFKLYVSDGRVFTILDPGDESGLFRKTLRISSTHVTRIERMPELHKQ